VILLTRKVCKAEICKRGYRVAGSIMKTPITIIKYLNDFLIFLAIDIY
jgi:hypothetical protein